jgi:hypothetical protein
MKIRDAHSRVSGEEKTYVMPSGGLEIVGDDGRTLYSLMLKDGQLEVSVGGAIKHGEMILDDKLAIIPVSINRVLITRSECK